MIRLKKIEKIYSTTGAGLGEVTADLSDGEWVTLLGASGSGKTTLLRLIAGLEEKSSGSIESPFLPEETSFVFQEPSLLPWKSVIDNVTLPLTLRGVDKRGARARAEKWINQLGLDSFREARPHELSGGLRMRVSLARALVTEPRLLLLDEPFAALDEPIRIELGLELRKLFLELKPTILLVTHSITEGLWLADRAMIVKGQPGRIVRDETLDFGRERPLALRGKADFLKRVEMCFELLKNSPIVSGNPS